MQITVTIPDEVAAEAQMQGMSVEAYVSAIVEGAGRKSNLVSPPRTREQIERFFDAMAEGSRELPLLKTESFTRESVYRDRN